MTIELSCAFATSLQTHEHVRVAESLGYRRAFCYDSPALYPDVWVQLCRATERTERIGLGPGVMVPSNRHVMTNAAAIATLVALVGEDRVTVAVGTGFTGRVAMGKRPLPWAEVTEYVRTLKALLRGERVTWDGAKVEMMHRPGFAPPRPIEVPFIIGAAGPKGIACARELGDGVISTQLHPITEFERNLMILVGTVVREGEDVGSSRVFEAAGHAASTVLHMAHEHQALPADQLAQWRSAYDGVAEDERHLAMHDGHLVTVNDHDRPFITPDLLETFGVAMGPDGWREHLAGLAEAGVTEVVYQPAGSDIPGELEAFAEVARMRV